MNIISFSGAATKIAAHAAHGKNILKTFKPDIICGISSGSLIILPLLLNKHDLLKKYTTNLRLEDIFKQSPVNNKGNITLKGYWRGIRKGAFGEMGLETMIEKFINECEYNKLMSNNNTPIILVGVTNMTKNKFELIEINKLSYKEAIQWIIASCTIPLYCNPVKIGDYFYYDGGLTYHNVTSEVIRIYKNKIKEIISVYSRPKLYNEKKEIDWGFNGKYLGRNLSKTFDVLQDTISKENEISEIELCNFYNIKLIQKFSPKILKGVYDVNKIRLQKLYNTVDQQY
jgi:predicted acylesterase/phospholipase RssA